MNRIIDQGSSVSSLWQSRRMWLILAICSLAAVFFAVKLMSTALPALQINITFTRAQAIVAAEQLQHKLFPELISNRTAVSFGVDRNLQTYVELEGGGIGAFKQQLNNPDVAPYAWNVRRFAEAQEQELWVSYTPDGSPLKFSLKIADKDPGAALEEDSARAIAEAGARAFLGNRFDGYKAFETTLVRQPSGRVDYSFTYEQESLKLGEARFRLMLIVAGDRLVTVNPYNHIPDAFYQRLGNMRVINNQIGQIADYLIKGALFLGGVIGGGFWLYRRHQLKLLQGLVPAVAIAFGLAGSIVCNLSSTWMDYNTSLSSNTFLLQRVIDVGSFALGNSLLFAMVFTVAEGLSRMAFAGHPRLFDFFRRPVAASVDVCGRILDGYIWVGFFLLYSMLFILLSRNIFGWWMPTDQAVDPNILSSWRPALGPIFSALQAGALEECLFRAVPLSAAVLIGSRYGIRKPLVIVTLVAQALLFGAAHAGYPQLPGYSRLVELFIPALFFGMVYLRFGLIPGILAHFVFDLVLMSVPIFSATASSLWIDKALVVLAGSLPLLIVLYARYRNGALIPLAAQWRNGYNLPTDTPLSVKVQQPQTIAAAQQNIFPEFLQIQNG